MPLQLLLPLINLIFTDPQLSGQLDNGLTGLLSQTDCFDFELPAVCLARFLHHGTLLPEHFGSFLSVRQTGVTSQSNALLRDRLRAIQLAFDGTRRYEDIARQTGRARSSVQLWIETFTAEGLDGLLSRKKAPGKSSAVQNVKVQGDITKGLREGRWRTGPQFAAWMEQTHGIELCPTQTYYWLKKAGAALKVPRPVHTKKDEAAAAAFKEGLFDALCALNLPAGSRVRIWVTDEARIGLHDASRRCWALRGMRMVKPRQQEYEWSYVYGALEVVEGASEFQLLPTVGLPLTHGFLRQIVKSDPEAFHVVIGDPAGFHFRPGDERLPEQVRIIPLPAYSPELNPVEVVCVKFCNLGF